MRQALDATRVAKQVLVGAAGGDRPRAAHPSGKIRKFLLRKRINAILQDEQGMACTTADAASSVDRNARRWESGAYDVPSLSPMAKLNAVDMLTRATGKALRMRGGIEFWSSSPIEWMYRDARAQRFVDGTNQIQKKVIARTVPGGDR